MTFNQIKKEETLLKDETKCPWLVAYLATTDAENNVKSYQATINTGGIEAQVVVNGLNNWEYAEYINNNNFRGPLIRTKYSTNVVAGSISWGWFDNPIPVWFTIDNEGGVYSRLESGKRTALSVGNIENTITVQNNYNKVLYYA